MEETKIWSIEGTSATPLNTTDHIESEGMLEAILTANPDMLEEGLQLVGRQTSTAGGPLDLLGVDGDGRLVVFELKRGRLTRDAVAQVIDYASSLNDIGLDRLIRHIEEQSGNFETQKIDDFGRWYSNNLPEEDMESLIPPRMVLVGLGMDDTTERMVNYLANGGIAISLLTFYNFVNDDGNMLLARHVEVDGTKPLTHIVASKRPGRAEQRRAFEEHAADLGISPLMNSIRQMLHETLRGQFNRLNESGARNQSDRLHYGLDYNWWKSDGDLNYKPLSTLFIEIGKCDEGKGGVKVGFHPIAVDLAYEEFKRLEDEGIALESSPSGNAFTTQRVNYEVKFPLYSTSDWDNQKEQIRALILKVCEEYKAAREKAEAGQ